MGRVTYQLSAHVGTPILCPYRIGMGSCACARRGRCSQAIAQRHGHSQPYRISALSESIIPVTNLRGQDQQRNISLNTLHVLGLDRDLRCYSVEVVLKLVFRGTNKALTARLQSRSTGATEHLEHVQDRKVCERALRAVVHLRSLDDD